MSNLWESYEMQGEQMATGFIYVVMSIGKKYLQQNLQGVPTWFDGRIYFGPCKKPMRTRIKPGDYLFGISPSGTFPRRIVFTVKVSERLTFAEAYKRYPKLRGPKGPIHVRPVRIPGEAFPDSKYEHIPGANHPNSWRSDIRTPKLDAFFVGEPAGPCVGRWLGQDGPIINGDILDFLKSCSVHGNAGRLSLRNSDATETKPVRHGHLYTGLHLETDSPKALLKLVCSKVDPPIGPIPRILINQQTQSKCSPSPKPERRTC